LAEGLKEEVKLQERKSRYERRLSTSVGRKKGMDEERRGNPEKATASGALKD